MKIASISVIIGGPICILLAFGIAACSTSQVAEVKQVSPLVISISSSVEFVGPDNIRLDESQYPSDVLLVFPFISGGIFGMPDGTALFIERPDDNRQFSIDLASKHEEIEQMLAPMTADWQASGLLIEPPATRLGRLGTFAFDEVRKQQIGGGGFIDPDTRDHLVLVYVDRPSRISGEFRLLREQFSHDLDFPHAGFHWIVVQKQGFNKFRLLNYTGQRVTFSIHIMQLQAI